MRRLRQAPAGIARTLALVACLMLSIAAAPTKQLDEATLQASGDHFTRAVQNKNKAAIAAVLADDVVIMIEVMGQVMTLDKRGYLAQLQRNWDKISDYEFKPTGGEITQDSPTKATVRITAMESVVINDVIMKVLNEQENVIELRNGKPVATAISMHLSVYTSMKL